MTIISIKENPKLKDTAINYISSKWDASRMIYDDCITHCITTSNPLPQWYLLIEENEIIGCVGLITNDFISRMDLYPWLCALYVEERQRGKSYGSLLIDKVKQDALRLGFKHLYLSTENIGYYEKFGFDYIGDGYHPWDEKSRIYHIKL